MADEETKQETPSTTDEDEDKDDVAGHKSRPYVQQRPDGDDNKPESPEVARPYGS